MQFLFLTACLTVCAMPLAAQQPLSQVSGNWGGTDQDGFAFIAMLTQDSDTARLRIWQGLGGVVEGDDPQLDVADMVLSAYTVENGQRLDLIETVDGTTLRVITAFADEEAEGMTTVRIMYLDNQFTVIGFAHTDLRYEGNLTYTCDADLWNGRVTVNGVTTDLPPRRFESLNASSWRYDTALTQGICPTAD